LVYTTPLLVGAGVDVPLLVNSGVGVSLWVGVVVAETVSSAKIDSWVFVGGVSVEVGELSGVLEASGVRIEPLLGFQPEIGTVLSVG
jgi:hypothetical protein